jgi:TolB-like protein
MKRVHRSLALFAATFLLVCSSAVFAARPTIAVLDFTADKNTITIGHGFIVREVLESTTNLLSSDLVTFLVKTNKFDVVERSRMKDILAEQEFSESGYISPETAVKLGKLIGADYFVMGKIEQFQATAENTKIPYTDTFRKTYEGKMTVNVRIVDSRGGKVVAANKFAVEHEDRNFKDEVTPDDFVEALKEKTVRTIVNGIVDGVFPLKVIRVEGDKIYINRGDSVAFKVGDTLSVVTLGEGLLDPDTGEVLGNAEEVVGTVTVTDIQNKFSVAKVVTGAGKIAKGAVVRIKAAGPAAVEEKELTPGSSDKPMNW